MSLSQTQVPHNSYKIILFGFVSNDFILFYFILFEYVDILR